MNQYHKINTLFKRDTRTNRILIGEWSMPEFEYLRNNQWEFTEKIDGTNIRVMWKDGTIVFGGKTDNASIPAHLVTKLNSIFNPKTDTFREIFDDGVDVCLYGEGFGNKIQKGGCYIPDGVDFALFDVKIGEWWLSRIDIEDIASKLNITTVPLLGYGSLNDAANTVRNGLASAFGTATAEGIVAKPKVSLFDRKGERIITKIKHCDFKERQ